MSKKALFLDRDGVMNVEKGYVRKIEDFHFLEGIFEVCHTLQELGFLIFIVSNRIGIGRKYFTIKDYFRATGAMIERFRENHINISKVYFSPSLPYKNCPRSKPSANTILEAKEEFDLDLERSILIGDKQSDMEAAKHSGIKHLFLIKSNHKINIEHLLSVIQ